MPYGYRYIYFRHALCTVPNQRRFDMEQLEQIEYDLRNFGQAKALVLGDDAVCQLRVICDRIWSLRVDMKRVDNENHVG